MSLSLGYVFPFAHPCRTLKTGQLTSYAQFDDGYYQTGLDKKQLLLNVPGSQYDGTVAITLNGKTDNHSNNCVAGIQTGLTWSSRLAGSVGPTSNGKLPWATNANGEGIFPYVSAANTAFLAGYSNWRIPNLTELLTLADLAHGAPSSLFFPSWPGGTASPVWTSNIAHTDAASGKYVDFNTLVVGNQNRTITAYLILVRTGVYP